MSDQGYRPVRGWLARLLWGACCGALLAVGVAAEGADPPKGGVRVPSGPLVPQPMPPNPQAPIRLTADLVLAVDADSECVVIASPADRLKVTADKGPLRVRGKFVDGNGSVETRTFAGSHVYFVEAAAEGECELLVLPVGGREADLIRRRILCVVGPQPPPVPPDPKPKPDGRLGLVKASREGAAKVTAPAGDAAKLAKAQRSLASAIAAGGVTEPAKILQTWREGNNAAVDSATWKAWGEQVSAALAQLHRDGKLPDKAAWVEAFTEVAEGLE